MKRYIVQTIAAIATNSYFQGFINGSIWQGESKVVCVPGLNCYSCPGALGSCPIGSLQASLGQGRRGVPYYVLGTILLFGVLFGRLICGFLCPFGFLQDLLYKIKVKKLIIPKSIDKPLRYLKYVVLIVFVVGLPLLLMGEYGIATPYFCKLICPAGTLEGGVPLLIANPTLRSAIGLLFSWKSLILVLVLVASTLIYRPFCKYLCPLGAIYGIMNRFSFYKLRVDQEKCTHCGLCAKVCKMGVKMTDNPNSAECIRCGLCKESCPTRAIENTLTRKETNLDGRN